MPTTVTPKIVGSNPIGVATVYNFVTLGLYPVQVSFHARSQHKIPRALWPALVAQRGTTTLRAQAEQHGVSHEAIRRTLQHAEAANQ